jgi:hypothetical protein
MPVSPTTPEYLKWYEVFITFDRSDHSNFIPKLSLYPRIVSLIVKDVKLNRVLIDGGISLYTLFFNTFDQMGLSRSTLRPSSAPFHGIIPGAVATPIGQITLPMTFVTQENFHTEYLQFEVADFETTYNAYLRWSTLTKFMAIPHDVYLVLKMARPHGVISIRGDVKRAYNYDMESCKTADRLTASAELQELKKALAESPPDPITTNAKSSIQLENSRNKTVPLSPEESSKVAHMGNNLDPK